MVVRNLTVDPQEPQEPEAQEPGRTEPLNLTYMILHGTVRTDRTDQTGTRIANMDSIPKQLPVPWVSSNRMGHP